MKTERNNSAIRYLRLAELSLCKYFDFFNDNHFRQYAFYAYFVPM